MARLHPTAGLILAIAVTTTACKRSDEASAPPAAATPVAPSAPNDALPAAKVEKRQLPAGPSTEAFTTRVVGEFREPWAMTFLPDGKLLVTEKPGRLVVFDPESGQKQEVKGVPEVDYGGQGGLGDVILHPNFSDNGWVYLSWAEAGKDDTRGAVVGRAKLVRNGEPRLEGLEVIWRQDPKVPGRGHYGHRLAFAPDGHLFITSGERQKFDPAQNLQNNLGSMIRLGDDGSVPKDNPFADKGGVTAQIWSYGHRNPLGIDFDAEGRLWTHEMGPKGGDEFNLIERGSNYGWPTVSNGVHYDGRPIPDHSTQPKFNAPEVSWVPSISPAGLVIYQGSVFPDWRGNAIIGGLSSRAIIRVAIDGNTAKEAARYDMGQRIREIEETPDGGLWVLEDQRDGRGGRLLELVPR